MKWIRSLVALAIAGTCAVAASRLADTAISLGPTRRLLIAADEIDPERVNRIELARDGKRFVFERVSADPSEDSAAETSSSQATWRQIEPVTHAADAWAVRQFISRVLRQNRCDMSMWHLARHPLASGRCMRRWKPRVSRLRLRL